MPINRSKLEQRLSACNKRLNDLFSESALSELIKGYILSVENYYNLSYEKAQKDKTMEEILRSYEHYVNQLSLVKEGILPRQQLVQSINESHYYRKLNVVLSDIAKAAELVFWISTIVPLALSASLIALPILVFQSYIGTIVSIVIAGLLVNTINKCMQCLGEFRSIERHNEEQIRETYLLSFFKPEFKKPSSLSEPTQEINIQPQLPCISGA